MNKKGQKWKNIFLKITGLSTIAIPLVAVISCTPDTQGPTQTYDFSDAKTKIIDVKSSKDRGELKAYLGDKIKGAKITLDGIGYKKPTNLPNGVTIDSEKYTLEEVMPDNAKTFKIKVTLKKGMEETTKTIEITAKDYDFGPIKIALGTEQISTKNRGAINTALITKTPDLEKGVDQSKSSTIEILSVFGGSTLIDTDLAKIGYTKPSELATADVEAEYRLKDKSKLLEEGKIELEVTLKKYLETQKHTITLKAKANDFAAEKIALDNKMSTKTKEEIATAISDKGVGTVFTQATPDDTEATFDDIGISKPILSAETKLEDKSKLASDGELKLKVTYTKDFESKEYIITIKAFTMAAALDLFQDAKSYKTKEKILIDAGNVHLIKPADYFGYTPPLTPRDGVTLKYALKSTDWAGADKNEFSIEVTITKLGLTPKSKTITITALL